VAVLPELPEPSSTSVACAGRAPDLARVLGRAAAASVRVSGVLGLLADALEDLAATVVVEVAAVEPARWSESRARRLREAVGRLLEGVDVELEPR